MGCFASFLSEVSTFVINFASIIKPSLSGKCWKESNASQTRIKPFFINVVLLKLRSFMAYCSLRNEMKRNDCSLRNENL